MKRAHDTVFFVATSLSQRSRRRSTLTTTPNVDDDDDFASCFFLLLFHRLARAFCFYTGSKTSISHPFNPRNQNQKQKAGHNVCSRRCCCSSPCRRRRRCWCVLFFSFFDLLFSQKMSSLLLKKPEFLFHSARDVLRGCVHALVPKTRQFDII